MADEDFDREMRDVDWAEVYERQAARGNLTPTIVDLLDLDPGDDAIELGCGPGYTVVRLARRLSPGTVYALDRRRAALTYLRLRAGAALEHVAPVVGDITALPLAPEFPIPTVVAFVLHHLEAPDRAVASIGSALPAGTPVLVIEYEPGAPGEVGPPPQHRVSAEDCTAWLSAAGFVIEETVELLEEKYGLLARRG